MSSPKIIVLKSSDGETFEVGDLVAKASQIIKYMIEDNCADTCIPLPNVTSKILAKVIEYMEKHVEAPKSSDGDKSSDEDLKSFDADFVKVDLGTLFDLVLAANYLSIKSLLDLTCQTVADMIKGLTPQEIRKFFNMKDITPEEEEEVRRENAWAFEVEEEEYAWEFEVENVWAFELENAWENVWAFELENAWENAWAFEVEEEEYAWEFEVENVWAFELENAWENVWAFEAENAWAFEAENAWAIELENAWENVWALEAEIAWAFEVEV